MQVHLFYLEKSQKLLSFIHTIPACMNFDFYGMTTITMELYIMMMTLMPRYKAMDISSPVNSVKVDALHVNTIDLDI